MPAASRHAKPKTFAPKLRALAVAATALAGVVAAFVFLRGGSAAPMSLHDAIPATSARQATADYNMIAAVHRNIAARAARQASLAVQAAARAAARPASTASPAPRTRIRSSITPSRQVARRTGRTTTGASGALQAPDYLIEVDAIAVTGG